MSLWEILGAGLACSRLSVAGDERKGARKKKNEGGLKRGVSP